MSHAPVLEITELRKSFRAPGGTPHLVVDVESFSLEPGEQVALRGESGSGKTTLLNLVAGILQADSGTIRVAGNEITALGEAARDRARALSIGYVFQTFNLLQGYTALENVLLGMLFGRGPDEDYCRELLTGVGLGDRMDYTPSQLSVGQQQRVALARALANHPALVLADEPTGNLDFRLAHEALDRIRGMCRASGAALLLVSHSPDVLGRFETVHELAAVNRVAAPPPAGAAEAGP